MDHVDEDDEDDMIMSSFAHSENSPFDDIQSGKNGHKSNNFWNVPFLLRMEFIIAFLTSPFLVVHKKAIESGDWDAIKANAASLSSGQPASPSAVMVQGEEEHDTIMSKITDHSEHSSQLHDIQSGKI